MISALFLAVAAPLTISFGEVDLTPTDPLPLGGYTERGDKKGVVGKEKLRGRFFALRQGSETIVVGCLEMLTLPEGFLEAIRARIPANTQLFLAATHTHSAPDSQMLNPRMNFRIPGISPFNRPLLESYSDRCADGIKSVLGKTPQLVQSLQVERWTASANRARRKGAHPDPSVTMLRVNGRDVWGVYAAHPTLHEASEITYSGDWPGVWMNRSPWVAMTGAIGDVSPIGRGSNGAEKSTSLVDNLVDNRRGVGKNRWNILRNAHFAAFPIKSGKSTPHPDFAKDNKVDPVLAQMAVSKFAPPELSLNLLRLGDTLWIGVPGEPSSGVAQRLRLTAAMRGIKKVVVMSHVNGWGGYMLEPEDYDRGGYEATLHFFGRGLASALSEALDRGITEMGFEGARASAR